MKTFNSLKKNLKKDITGLPEIRIALLGDSSTQLLAQAICGYGVEKSVNLNLFEGGYNQIDQLILNTNSELYQHKPEVIIVFYSYNELKEKFYFANQEDKLHFTSIFIEKVKKYYKILIDNSLAKIVFLNLPEVNDAIFGSFALRTEASLLNQIRKINSLLYIMAKDLPSFYIADFNSLVINYGYNMVFSSKLYIGMGFTLSLDILPAVSLMITDVILALNGHQKKCVILDLDNTLWGGIIGDDGIENIELGNLGKGKAFVQFQMWLKQLKERGILLCVCSKNEELVAKEVFENHPDMVLQLDDFAMFVVNWKNKADNIQTIKQRLNISYDSMAFIDDSAFEREIVKSGIPDICVPDLPVDPVFYKEYLQSLNLFETVSYTENDVMRTRQYQDEAKRNNEKDKHFDEKEFLKNLNMEAVVHLIKPDSTYLIPRIAQLCQRTNQFNLTTKRFTESEILSFSKNPDYLVFAFELGDKFGNNGLVSAIIVKVKDKNAVIVNWVMSCRVFNRGLKMFIINFITDSLKQIGVEILSGEYIPTVKNKPVSNLFSSLGFYKNDNDNWELILDEFIYFKNFIKEKNG